jgi:glutathione S-transferase
VATRPPLALSLAHAHSHTRPPAAPPARRRTPRSYPENYGLVFGGLFATAAANLYCAINVSIHRKKFGIKYPALYASEAEHLSKECKAADVVTFNCAQRAHQNTLESLTGVQLQGALVGLLYPRFAGSCLGLYAVGRVLYCNGYTAKGPSGRMAGGLVSHLGDLPLLIATGYCAYTMIMG